MGLQDREYMKERRGESSSTRSSSKTFFKIKGGAKINITVGSMIFITLAIIVLLLAIAGDAQKPSTSCRIEKIALDSNGDGNLTYREFGGGILKIVPQPIRAVSQIDALAPILGFFELNKNNCNSRGSILASGFLLLIFFLTTIYVVSLAFFLLRKLMRFLVFDVLGTSPYGKYKSLLSGLLSPHFVWVIKPVAAVIFVAALTIIFITKVPSANVKQKSENNILEGGQFHLMSSSVQQGFAPNTPYI